MKEKTCRHTNNDEWHIFRTHHVRHHAKGFAYSEKED
jgi:hypothetical protein